MIKHTQAIRQILLTNCQRVFDRFVGLALKELVSKWQDTFFNLLQELFNANSNHYLC